MKLNVGDYVRLKGGVLGKIIDKYKIGDYYKIKVDIRNGFIEKHKEDLFTKYVVKSSPDIIDLIEVGDLMFIDISPDNYGGIVVPRIAETQKEWEGYYERLESGEYVLKRIITKEQMEQMEYKVED